MTKRYYFFFYRSSTGRDDIPRTENKVYPSIITGALWVNKLGSDSSSSANDAVCRNRKANKNVGKKICLQLFLNTLIRIEGTHILSPNDFIVDRVGLKSHSK